MSIKTALLAFIPISKEIRRAEREYIDMSPPPPPQLTLYIVDQKKLYLWNLNYRSASYVLIWQLWMLRINDRQKLARGLVHIENE